MTNRSEGQATARPTVSVVIPAYRAEATILQTLASVYAQSQLADEVIVVDDGSPDDTAAVVERAYPSVRVLRQANGGPAKARNTGAAAASGEWLAFLDADDAWLPDKLKLQLRMTGDPKLAVIGTRIVGWPDDHFDPTPGFDSLWQINRIGTSTALVRRSAYLQAGGMSEDLPLCEDYHLWLRLCAEGWRFAVCDAPLTTYAPAPDSLTQKRVLFAETERLCFEDIATRFSIPPDRLRRRVADSFRKHARGALAFRDMRAARHLLWRSLRYSVTAGQLAELLAANLPAGVLDLRRKLVASSAPPAVNLGSDR